jgi:molybdopterin converting factor small subunit
MTGWRWDVKISLFGALGETIGREVELPLPGGTTIGEARRMLAERHPEAAAMLAEPHARACLDDKLVGETAVVGAGAELAFLPPLSGG